MDSGKTRRPYAATRKLIRYSKAYGRDDPQLSEGDIFRVIIPVPEFSANGGVEHDALIDIDMLHERQKAPYSKLRASGWQFQEFVEGGGVALGRGGERAVIDLLGEVVRRAGR